MKSQKAFSFLLWFFWSSIFISQSLMDFSATLLGLGSLGMLIRTPSWQQQAKAFLRGHPLSALCVIWFLIVATGLLFIAPKGPKTFTYLIEFRWMLEIGLWVLALRFIRPSPSHLYYLAAAPALSATYGIFSWVTGLSPLIHQDVPERLGGFLGNPMPYAHLAGPVFAAMIGIGLSFWARNQRLHWSWWLLTLILGASLLLAMTRGVWIAAFCAIAMVPFLLKSVKATRLSLMTLILGLATVFIVPQIRVRVMDSFDPKRSYDSERTILWKANFRMFLDHPVLGVGYTDNTRRLPEYYTHAGLPENQFRSHAHNQFLHFLAGTGFLGLACYLIFISWFLVKTWNMIRRLQGSWLSSAAIGLFMAQISFHIGSLTESNFSIAKNRALILFLFGIAAALHTWKETEGELS